MLGVYREQIFSPGKIKEDAAILDATLDELFRQGHAVCSLRAETLDIPSVQPACALTMAQSDRALDILEIWQKKGIRIINSTLSVRQSYRKPLIRLLGEAGMPIPSTSIFPLEEVEQVISFPSLTPYWLKRGDVHAMEPGDVVKVGSKEGLMKAVHHFRSRRIGEILVQGHVEGEVIKFYGVRGGHYFSAFLASTGEEVTSETGQLPVVAQQSAEAIGLEVYGGDAIIPPNGKVVLIDLNDWPSFSRCCQAAAKGIARYITSVFEGGPNGSSSRS